MTTELTIKWLEKVIAKTKQLLINETSTSGAHTPYGISLGGKLRAYRDCLEFINVHPTDPAVRGFKDDNSLI